MEHNIVLVKKGEIDMAFPVAQPFLERALDYNANYDIAMVLNDVHMGFSNLFIVYGTEPVGAFVTRTHTGGTQKQLIVHLLGGDNFKEWAGLFKEKIRDYRKKIGLDCVVLVGRPGWKSMIPELRHTKTLYYFEDAL